MNKKTKISDKSEELVHTIDQEEFKKATMTRSRLQDGKSSKMKRNLLLSLLGVIALLASLFLFGPQLLVQYSILVGNMRSESEEAEKNENIDEQYVPPPSLQTVDKATKEKNITIKGTGEKGQTIELYINNKRVDRTTVKTDEFTFAQISLNEGENVIKAKAIKNKKASIFSNEIKTTYREKAPEVELETPKDGDAFSGSVSVLKVKGKTAPYAKVTINDAWAIMDDEGIFRYDYRMQSGENKLMLKITDEVGNVTEKEVKFTYFP